MNDTTVRLFMYVQVPKVVEKGEGFKTLIRSASAPMGGPTSLPPTRRSGCKYAEDLKKKKSVREIKSADPINFN